jgi:GT2 family glycosyltransferase
MRSLGPFERGLRKGSSAVTTLSTVIVTHDSGGALAATVPALLEQLRPDDELIVVDNSSRDASAATARRLAPNAIVIETDANLGFAAGCNRGVAAASGELVCLLNPDAVPQPGWRAAIELPLVDGRGWSAWQGLVTSEDGRKINSRGGVVHFTGIAWAGGAGEQLVEEGSGEPELPDRAAGGRRSPRSRTIGPEVAGDRRSPAGGLTNQEPGFVSGACLAIPRDLYLRLGGMPEGFFLYHEDVDLSFRARLAGGRLGVEPAARVDHDYEFLKGPGKWRYLERNRWATLVRTYPGPLLALLAPALFATELALLVVSASGGWLAEKLRAIGETLVALPRLLRERRSIQASRSLSAGEFALALTPELDSAYLGAAARSPLLAGVLRGYWSLVLALLGAGRR